MSVLTDVAQLVRAAPHYTGYAATGALPPYVVTRPLVVNNGGEALDGSMLSSDHSFSLYCVGASVEASYNLALEVMAELQGAPVGGTTLSTSMGYSGAQVEGNYESQVTVQLNQGGI